MKKEYPFGKRGFASMSPELQRAIASKGGKTAVEMGVAHRWNSEEARAAGRKGGMTLRKRGHDHFVKLGKAGGEAKRDKLLKK